MGGAVIKSSPFLCKSSAILLQWHSYAKHVHIEYRQKYCVVQLHIELAGKSVTTPNSHTLLENCFIVFLWKLYSYIQLTMLVCMYIRHTRIYVQCILSLWTNFIPWSERNMFKAKKKLNGHGNRQFYSETLYEALFWIINEGAGLDGVLRLPLAWIRMRS